MHKLTLLVFFLITSFLALAQGPKILVITAHPDDEQHFLLPYLKLLKN